MGLLFCFLHGFLLAYGRATFTAALFFEEEEMSRLTDTYASFASIYLNGSLRVSGCNVKKHE